MHYQFFVDDVICRKDKPAAVGLAAQVPAPNSGLDLDGLTAIDSSDTDEESESASSNVTGPSGVLESRVTVRWPFSKPSSSKEPSQMLRVLDRPFYHGDVIARNSAAHKSAKVVGVNVFVDLEVIRTKEKLYGVPSYQMIPLHPFLPGRTAIADGWVGKIEHCLCDVTVQFTDGSVCSVARCTLRELIPWDVEPDELDELLEIDQTITAFFPGQKVRAAPSVWTAAKWLRGQYNNKKHREALVIFVQPSAVAVHWFTTWLSGDKISPPPFLCSPSQIQVLDHYGSTKFRVGDHVIVDWPNLRAAHKKPPTSFRCPPNPLTGVQLQLSAQSQHNASGTPSDAASKFTTQRNQSFGPTTTPNQQDTAPSASRPSSRFNFGFPKMLSSQSPATTSSTGRVTPPTTTHVRQSSNNTKLALLAEKEKKKRQKHQARNCARILRSYTLIDIQWQDATVELHRPSVEFHSKPASLDFFPEDFVLLPYDADERDTTSLSSSETSPPRSPSTSANADATGPSTSSSSSKFGRQGVVLRVDAVESMCEIRWLDNGEIQHVSLYSISKHPQFDFTLGDTVMRVPNGSVASQFLASPSNTQSSSSSPNHSPPRQPSIDGLPKDQSSASSNGIGQIIDIFDGRVVVAWSDGSKSTVGPETLFLIDDEDYVEDDARQPLAGNEEASEEEEEEEEEVEEDEEDEDEEAEEDDDAAEDAVVADSPKSVRKSTDDDLEENESESSSPGDRNQSNANVELQSSQPNGVASSNQHDQEDASSSSSSEANADPARGHTVGSSTESGSRANSLRRKGARKGASQEANFRIGVAGADTSAPSTIPASNRALGAIVDEDESRRHSRDEDEEAIHAVREAIQKDLLSSSARSGGDSSTPKPDGPTSATSSSRNALQEDGLQSSTTSNRSQSYKSNRVIKTGSPASRPTMYISALRKNSIGSLDDSETSEASQSQSDSVSRHETASDRAKQIDKIRRRMERMRLLGSVDESDQSGALSESSSSESGEDVVTQDQLDDDEEDDEEGTATDVFQSSQADDDDDDADTNSETSASASASASLSTPGESLLSATSKAEQREAELAKLASQISISVRIASSESGREETTGSMSQRSGSGTNLHTPGTPSGHRRSPSGNVSGPPGATSLRSVVASIPSLDHHHFLSAPTPSNAKHIHKKMRKELKLIRSSQLDGIWVNSFEEHVHLLSALISGPVGTPYHLSLHQIDLALSDGYPDDSAPEVFYRSLVAPSLNPMINDDGTLCLSLLTLWSRRGSGDSSRWWNPDQANLMQVLLSIQGLLFGVQFPIFLQQPRLQQHKSKETQRLAMLYNERILLLSLQHIYRMLSSPPSQFEALIRDFYRANRDGLTRLADLLQPLARSRKQTNANSNKELLAFASSEIPAANAHVRQFGISYDPPPTQGFLVVFDKLMNKLKPLLVDL